MSLLTTALVGLLLLALFKVVPVVRAVLFPQALPGIPHNALKLGGDVPELIKAIKDTKEISRFFEENARRLGPISQMLLGTNRFVLVADAQEVCSGES